MENIHSIFLSEAKDLISELEGSLLKLEHDKTNKDSISSVFRAMHTLKGSAGMFGFDAINALTHQLETIYDAIRENQRPLTPDILTVTFLCLDHLQKLLTDPQMNERNMLAVHEGLLKEIEKLVLGVSESPEVVAPLLVADKIPTLYLISFQFNEDILKTGTNTLYLAEDLLALGTGMVLPYFTNLPKFQDLDPEKNYTSFETVLRTTHAEVEIKEVFMFVENECKLNIEKSGLIFDDQLAKQVWEDHDINRPGGFDFLLESVGNKIKDKKEFTGIKLGKGNTGSSIRVGSERLDELMNLVSELVTTQARLSLFSTQNESGELLVISENVEKITRRLRDNAFSMSLVPIESLVVRFQRLVRDLSSELKKDIVFKTEGTETEIDKSIIEKLTDPLLHLLRNSLDHGIELPDVREKKGKSKQGTLLLKSYYSGANVFIDISDDGAGINLEKVRQKAISKNLILPDSNLEENELIKLIFMPGFSTADQVTGVSGRGVGMDVVKRNITDLRGDIEVITRENSGTTFSIRLPLTLSIIDGLLVRIANTDFILPLSSVNKCYELDTKILESTFNQWVTLEGHRTPFFYLRKDFNIEQTAPEQSQIIKIAYEGVYVGLAVDRIIGEYQAVLKPLGTLFHGYDEFSGATILGDGTVALVIDPYKLIKKLVSQHQINLKLTLTV